MATNQGQRDDSEERCAAVIEAFLREGEPAVPHRVRQWMERNPECRHHILAVAGRMAEATLLGHRRAIAPGEQAEIRRWAVARADEVQTRGDQPRDVTHVEPAAAERMR